MKSKSCHQQASMEDRESFQMAPRTGGEDVTSLRGGRRYWCVAVLAALGVATAVFVLVVLPALLLTAQLGDKQQPQQSTLLLEDIVEQWYSQRWFNGSWLTDTEFLFKNEKGQLLIHNVENQTSTLLIKNDSLVPSSKSLSYVVSANQRFVLVGFNATKRFRHHFGNKFVTVDLEAQASEPLENSLGLPDPGAIQVALWAPQGDALAYVYRNNLYYRPSAGDPDEFPITTSGVPGVVYHGASDWIYEDAVLSTHHAVWFSSNGTKLAYASFNDTAVKSEPITWYGDPGTLDTQYTNVVFVKYPKPGTTNPAVTLTVVDVDDVVLQNHEATSIDILPPQNLSEPILMSVTWATDDEVAAVWHNRVATRGCIVICDYNTRECRELWRMEATEGWFGLYSPPRFSKDGSRMLLVLPQEQDGDVGAFRHLTLISNGSVAALSVGLITVTEVLYWDEDTNLVFVMAHTAQQYERSHMYSVPDDPATAPHEPRCITCGVRSAASGVECLVGSASFSRSGSYYVHQCLGPDIPDVTIYNKAHEMVSVWEDNGFLVPLLKNKAWPQSTHVQVAVPGGFTAHAQLWLPPRMDPNAKYPLVVDVYAGPDSSQVSERFNVDWRVFLTTNLSYVYAVIDGRGSSLRGDLLAFASHRRVGTVEIEDQITVTKHLLSEYQFLDPRRTAIWGWSYGGYSTLRVLINDTEGVFKCGMSVAPVTDWNYYTSVYTERILGLPTEADNLQGYQQANVMDKLDNLRNKKLLLVHGTFDNIVLYQNFMMLCRALDKRNILFQQQSYPDEDHWLDGVGHHLFSTMTHFLQDCFVREKKLIPAQQ